MKQAKVVAILIVVTALLSACMTTSETVVQDPALQTIVKRGELLVGTAGSMPPFNMTTREGKIIGLEPDLARLMASAMNVKLRLVAMPFPDLLPALERGEVDMVLSDLAITPQRNLKVAFVGPYFISGKSFVTKTDAIATAKTVEEINNPYTKLAALEGSTSQVFVEKLIPKATLVLTKNYDEAVDLVLRGQADALVAEYPFCLITVFRHPGEGLMSPVNPLTYEPIGIAMPGDDPLLVNWVQNFLGTIQGSGELKRMTQHWFNDGWWIGELP